MSTRREFTQGSMAALLMALLASLKVDAADRAPLDEEPFPLDPNAYEHLVISMLVSSGLRPGEDGFNAVMGHMLLDEVIAPEQESARDQCRRAMYAVLERLEAA